MRLIIAAIIRLCIVLYNDHNRSGDHSFKSSSNFGTMDSDLEGVIVEIQWDNIRAVMDPEFFFFMHGFHSHCFCNKLGLGDVF